MAQVDWNAVFQFCAQHREQFAPEDQKALKRSMWGLQMCMIAGVISAVTVNHIVFRLPALRVASPLVRFNMGALSLSTPVMFWGYVGIHRILKPTFLEVFEKNGGLR